jgi:predicted GH43/DUF377 family glycosyl hydrolase
MRPGDISAPSHSPGSPSEGSYAKACPLISIEITDPGQINESSIIMRVNGTQVSPTLAPIAMGYNVSFNPPAPYSDGTLVNVSVSAADISGNGFNHSWSFLVDAIAPAPPANFTLSKSRIEATKRGLVLNIGATYDSRHAFAPSVLYIGGQYKMWYAASNGTGYHVCYATSPNGQTWTKLGMVLYRGLPGQPDSYSATYPTVIYDGEYKMWYSGSDGTTIRVMYANSTDGINWVKRGIAVDVGSEGSMDSQWAYFPSVLKTDEYKMWYSGMDGLVHRVLYANSTDGLTWTKHPADITPSGAGVMYGDGIAWSPEVAYYNGTYHMYCGRYDGFKFRAVHSTSTDGINWNELGVAVDAGETGEYDYYRAEQCGIIKTEYETKIWYSAYNGANWRIMFANITPGDLPRDLALAWTPSPSQDVVGYELYRESRPSAFSDKLSAARPEFYEPPTGLTKWTFENHAVANATVLSAPSGAPVHFCMPDDNIKDMALYARLLDGAWAKLVQGSDYGSDMETGYVSVYYGGLEPGATLHAWYNHSASMALRAEGSATADVRAGAGSPKSYYYVIRAVDRAGNIGQCQNMPCKMGVQINDAWSLLSAPALEAPSQVGEVFEGLNWTHARTWDPAKWPNHWTSNMPISIANSLLAIGPAAGFWVRTSAPGALVTIGRVANLSIPLTAGWNLVAFPYHEMRSVGETLAGIPWDRVECSDPSSQTLLQEFAARDALNPGQGFWVHVTSDCIWTASNLPW